MLSRRGFVTAVIGASGSAMPRLLNAEPGAAAPGADGFTTLRAVANETRPFGVDAPPVLALTFGSVPGPVIRARRGQEIRVRLVNALNEPTAIHWHGLRLPNAMDGAPPLTPAVAPGATFDHRFIAPDAGTFWYHAAAEPQRLRGLFGALIVDEPMPPSGVDSDHVLVFAAALSRVAPKDADNAGGAGGAGDPPFAVNGATSVDLAVRQNERLRMRFINASARSVMSARIDTPRLWVMAFDGQPAEPFVPHDGRIVLGPGNRADVFLDATAAAGSIVPVRFAQIEPQTGREAGGEATLLRLIYQGSPLRQAPLAEPSPLPAGSLPARMDFARALRATLALGGPDPGGGKTADRQAGGGLTPPLFIAAHGRTVMLALDNRGSAKAVHLHGHHFRLLDRLDDGWKPYWLDTVLVPERQTMRVAFVADNPGRWAIQTVSLDGSPTTSAWFQVS
jgi:FtsP/CotA-like multicopper oxidase with cupredoxin domain